MNHEQSIIKCAARKDEIVLMQSAKKITWKDGKCENVQFMFRSKMLITGGFALVGV